MIKRLELTSFPRTTISVFIKLALCASLELGLVIGANAATYTWTRDSVATQTWTATDNWAGGAVYHDPGTSADILTFYNDTTTALANGLNSITTSVPSALTMNVLTLNGRGATSGASNIVIATNASTWTLGGTSPAGRSVEGAGGVCWRDVLHRGGIQPRVAGDEPR
jgi:hypothetical protein